MRSIVETTPINGLLLHATYTWLGQDQEPEVDALAWPAVVDFVAVTVALQAADGDDNFVPASRWWPADGLIGFTLRPAAVHIGRGSREADLATGLFRSVGAVQAEDAARGAVAAAIARITASKTSRRDREAQRERALDAAGLPSWLRGAGAPGPGPRPGGRP